MSWTGTSALGLLIEYWREFNRRQRVGDSSSVISTIHGGPYLWPEYR